MENTEDFAGKKLGENLEKNRDIAFLSKKLATIECGLDLNLNEDALRLQEMDFEKLRSFYEQHDFKSLLKNLEARDKKKENEATLIQEAMQVNSPKELKRLMGVQQFSQMALYLSMSEKKSSKDDVVKLFIKADDQYFFVECENEFQYYVPVLKPYLEDKEIIKTVYDSKMIYRIFWREGTMPQGVYWDLMLGYYLLDPEKHKPGLLELILEEINLTIDETYEKAGVLLNCVTFLCEKMERELQENNLADLYLNVEMQLAKVLALMELAGISIDKKQLEEAGKMLDKKIKLLQKEIYEEAGSEFNINSPKQLAEILFDKLGLQPIKKTKTGYSTNIEVLEILAAESEVAAHIIDYRQHMKLKTTYVDGLLNEINPLTDKIHTTFNQAITATGRLSSTEPNLQNIPIRLEEGRRLRKAFIPSKDGHLLLSADYSQIELRILAHVAQDATLLNSFLQDEDIHARTAAEIFGIDVKNVDESMRRKAKAVNFGIIYGLSDFGLARDLHISREEASTYIDNYFSRYERVKEWIDDTISDARRDGYVYTILGRRRALKDINNKNYNLRKAAERMAVNTPIQGSAADIIKLAMISIQKELEKSMYKSLLLLQVHDELVFECPPQEISRLIPLVKSAMQNAIQLMVPLTVDIKVGFNWYEMEKI